MRAPIKLGLFTQILGIQLRSSGLQGKRLPAEPSPLPLFHVLSVLYAATERTGEREGQPSVTSLRKPSRPVQQSLSDIVVFGLAQTFPIAK